MQNAPVYDQQFFEAQAAGSLASARAIVPELLKLADVTSLVDVGCGVGTWASVARECGISRLIGLDGEYVPRSQLLISENDFRSCDLLRDNILDAVLEFAPFDLALCVEVAEHLPLEGAEYFVSELCKLSDLVVFSAAIPGQGGTDHVNEQWPEFWCRKFEIFNFACFDLLRSRLWNRDECDWWYLQNLLVFARVNSTQFYKLASQGTVTASPMALVHPRCLHQKAAEYAAYVGELQQMLTYQPFGREEAIKVLEERIDSLRTLTKASNEKLEMAQAENEKLKRRVEKLEKSWIWRLLRI